MKALFAIGALFAMCFAVVSAAPNDDNRKHMHSLLGITKQVKFLNYYYFNCLSLKLMYCGSVLQLCNLI